MGRVKPPFFQEEIVNKKKIDRSKLIARDTEMVEGIFRFHDVPGGTAKFNYRKHLSVPMAYYEMKDGQKYKIHRMVAEHINDNTSYPVYEYKEDASGKAVVTVVSQKKRCSFQALDFSSAYGTGPSNIVTVELDKQP